MSPAPAAMMRGRCFCGAVRFSVESPIASAAHCHCESCRRAHSAAFVTWARVGKSQLNIETGLGLIQKFNSSAGAFRSFCKTCGSPLFMEYVAEPAAIYIPVATLTTPPDRAPDKHLSFEEAVPWLACCDDLPRFRGKTAP